MPVLLWPNGLSTIPATSSEYGMRFHPIDKVWRLHAGIDEVGYVTVCSPVEGTIIFAGYSGGYGNLVKVRETATGDEHWLAHNARFLRTSGAVSPGTPLAIMGTTGASTGIHSHHEVHLRSGGTVNPRSYYAGRGTSAAGGGSTPEEDDMFTDQDRANLTSVMLALGASDLNASNEPKTETAVKIMQSVQGQVNGLPDRLTQIMGQVNGVPEVLAQIRADIKGISASGGQVDVDALASKLRTALTTDIVKALGAALING